MKRKKQTRRKRKSRMQLYRARRTPTHFFVTRISPLVRGGNPLGVGEWTLYVASPASFVG